MSLKEFDAKQFLLEKGEQVGLGIALTLMVLMLIWNLFIPPQGFFSGSPASKAEVLDKGTKELETALRSKQPTKSDLPDDPKSHLINLDTTFLQPEKYKILGVFEPRIPESPSRRRPLIYNIVEGAVADAHMLIDTYLFEDDFQYIWVLRGPDGKPKGAGGSNPFDLYQEQAVIQQELLRLREKKGAGGMPMSGGGSNPMVQQKRGNMFRVPGSGIQGVAEKDTDFEPTRIPRKDWNQQETTARQPRPLRVAIIGGSFPYKAQLEEFQRKLRLPDINAVINENLPDKEKVSKSFEFLSVEVERAEVDADNKVGEWRLLNLAGDYQEWLERTFWPFQAEDPKVSLVKFDGLVLPLLRVFHANKKVDPTMRTPGMMRPGMPQAPGPREADEESTAVKDSDYPDIVDKLPRIQDTLIKLSNVQSARIAAPIAKKDAGVFNPFHPYATPPADNAELRTDPKSNVAQDLVVPEYALVRLVDVNLMPGKSYRYRVRVKMTNPNYNRADVASPAYKLEKDLTSKNWYEIKQTVHVQPELMYYVVDEKQVAERQEQREIIGRRVSAQSRMWAVRGPSTDQVVFQFHRWVESASLSSKESDTVPVGDWAVADRVFVSRGEYVGQRVRVDLPIWKFAQNTFVLPVEEQKKSRFSRKLSTTGIDVDFGFDSSPLDTILVDFEGGRVFGPARMDDTSRMEVLMLSPEGKLLARNSATDTANEKRKERRDKVLKRIENIREGKAAE